MRPHLLNLVLAAAVWTAPAATGAVIYTTFGPADAYNTSLGWTVGFSADAEVAASFTPAIDTNLFSVRVAGFGVASNEISAAIRTDNSGEPGDDVENLGTFSFDNSGSIEELFSVTNPLLSAGTTYWLVLFDPASTNTDLSAWNRNNQGIEGVLLRNTGTVGWEPNVDPVTPAFEINGTEIPEPSTMGVAAVGFALLVAARRRLRA